MILLNIFWLCLAPYYYMVFHSSAQDNDHLAKQDEFMNLLATIGDLAFIIHDWLFTLETMMASLQMPIAIKLFNEDYERESLADANFSMEMRRVRNIKWLANLTFCMIAVAWFTVSTVTGMFVWRMSIDMVWLYITTVYIASLLKIRKMINKVNKTERLRPNHDLMRMNLATFIFEWLVYLNVFVVATQVSDSSGNDDYIHVSDCRITVTFEILYWFLWVALILRTCITSYMNVKFSRDLSKTNR